MAAVSLLLLLARGGAKMCHAATAIPLADDGVLFGVTGGDEAIPTDILTPGRSHHCDEGLVYRNGLTGGIGTSGNEASAAAINRA